MSTRISSASENLEWKKAYLAAVCEKDRSRIPGLIQHARELLAVRLRELWLPGSVPHEEIEAVHDALYMLEALLNSLSYRDDTGETEPGRCA